MSALVRRVAALEQRVKDLRRRSVLPPDVEALARFISLTFGEEAEQIGRECEEVGSLAPVLAALEALSVPTQGEALRGAVGRAIAAVIVGDARGYAEALSETDEALQAFCLAGEPHWWDTESGTFSASVSPKASAAASELTPLDRGGFLLSVADRFRPWPQWPTVEKAAASPVSAAVSVPEARSVTVGEKLAAEAELLPDAPMTDEQVEKLRRLPGEAPAWPEGVPRHSDTRGWKQVEPEGLADWERWR